MRGILCVVLLVVPQLGGAAAPPRGAEIAEIAEGVFVHRGVHVGLDDPRHDDIANTAFIVGEKCVAVIDTGGSIGAGTRLLEAIHSRTTRPICYVINTHVHYDHVLGNAAFRRTGAKFVGHRSLADAIAASRDFFVQNYAADLGEHAGPDAIVAPDVLVDGALELDLGNRVLELRAHPAAHTTSDLSALDRRTGTLLAGDLLFMERVPVIDGSLRGWLAVMSELETVKANRVVPGHGPASAPWPAAAADQRRYLEAVLDGVQNDIAAGRFLEEALESTGREERDRWQLFEDAHRRNLTRAFTELEWE